MPLGEVRSLREPRAVVAARRALQDYLRGRYGAEWRRVFAGLVAAWDALGLPPLGEAEDGRALHVLVVLLAAREQSADVLAGAADGGSIDRLVAELRARLSGESDG